MASKDKYIPFFLPKLLATARLKTFALEPHGEYDLSWKNIAIPLFWGFLIVAMNLTIRRGVHSV